MTTKQVMTYTDLADAIEGALGQRPALSTLRSAAARSAHHRTYSRITAGMPSPLPDRVGRQVVFDASQVRAWLKEHPRRTHVAWQTKIIRSRPAARTQTIEGARDAGLSWDEIAAAISTADGTTYTKQAAHQRYGGAR